MRGVRAVLRIAAVGFAGAALVGVVLAASAGREREADAVTSGWPIGAAGRACQLVEDVDTRTALGAELELAAGAVQGSTYTCVLTSALEAYPDLTLAATPTTIDKLIFDAIVKPSGTTGIKGLGLVAYALDRPAKAGHGPAVEVGWLSNGGWLMVARYTFEDGAAAAQVEALRPQLVALAQQIEATLVQ